MLGSLGRAVQHVEHMGKGRLVFINTCGFIDPAVRESVRAVVDAIQRLGKCKVKPLLAVGGCMVGRYGAEELTQRNCLKWTFGCPRQKCRAGLPWWPWLWGCQSPQPALWAVVGCFPPVLRMHGSR